jgi:putative transposase
MPGDRYRIGNQNDIYFLTITVVDWVDLFTRKDYAIIVVDSLKYCIENKGLEVFAYCIMSSHIHIVCRVKEPFTMSGFLRDFKKFTSKEISNKVIEIGESRREWLLNKFEFEAKRTGRAKDYKIWTDDSHAIEIFGYIRIEEKINYIHQNPVKAMIVYSAEQYVFSSAIDYGDGIGLIKITKY